MRKLLITLACSLLMACTQKESTDYQTIAFKQNELIIAYEEKVEELATVIQIALPAYKMDYGEIDSLNYELDSLYIADNYRPKSKVR